MKKATRFVQNICNMLGVSITRARRQEIPFSSLPGGAPGTVLDIGANEGQFAGKISKWLPDAEIYSFEPLPAPFKALQQLAARNSKLHCFNTALGAKEGSVDMYTGSYTPSSSLLKPTSLLSSIMPEVVPTTTAAINVVTLDSIFDTLKVVYPLFIKIDVQGFEKEVILGGIESIQKASALFVELSFDEIYQGQPLFFDIARELSNLGFQLVDIVNLSRNPKTDLAFQCEGLFINRHRMSGEC
jgi:FkbM family methyltransferase